jgi:hypothetical protein
MSDMIKFENLQDRIIELRGQSVLLDVMSPKYTELRQNESMRL